VADDEDRGGINAAAPHGPREIHEREADAKKVPATKYGQYRNASPPSFPRFGGWHLFIYLGTFLSSSAMLAEMPVARRSFDGR
jgi:hypothetical protein